MRSRREKGESGEKSQFRCFDSKEEYERTITASGSTDESRPYVDVVLVKRTNLFGVQRNERVSIQSCQVPLLLALIHLDLLLAFL